MRNIEHTGDMVAVVRCHQCKHRAELTKCSVEWPDFRCPLRDPEGYIDDRIFDRDWYCADGERREGE